MSATRTLRYGGHPDQVADLWLPTDRPPSRLVVSLHGGFFRPVYDRSIHDPLCAALVGSGLAVLNVEYRRTGTAGTPQATTDDVRAAVDLADAEAAALDASLPPGVAVVGHSAGGYLALWAGRLPATDLVVALAPVADLARCATDGHGGTAVPDWVGGRPDTAAAAYRNLDLAAALPTGTRTVLVHGTRDDVVPPTHSQWYADAAAAAGDPVTLLLLEGEDHFGLTEPGLPAFEEWRRVVVAWAAQEHQTGRP